ncbi:cupin domain-containing protein [Candidatus Poribacteria bacterium]|nr:cupin domain-containing protein [Candidatus Poribacteria bacterium]
MQPASNLKDPSLCIVRLSRGERIREPMSALLNPIDPASLHEYRLPANAEVELHFHDFDEYWLFTAGEPTVTLRLPDGGRCEVRLSPGDMVACLRGVEHTLRADHELVYFQLSSVLMGVERMGHLTRDL